MINMFNICGECVRCFATLIHYSHIDACSVFMFDTYLMYLCLLNCMPAYKIHMVTADPWKRGIFTTFFYTVDIHVATTLIAQWFFVAHSLNGFSLGSWSWLNIYRYTASTPYLLSLLCPHLSVRLLFSTATYLSLLSYDTSLSHFIRSSI